MRKLHGFGKRPSEAFCKEILVSIMMYQKRPGLCEV